MSTARTPEDGKVAHDSGEVAQQQMTVEEATTRILDEAKKQFKVVHFVRHGEGYHNIGHEGLDDAPLTSRGWKDAEALRTHLEALDPPLEVEVVIVSPLKRALETASAVFGGGALVDGVSPLMTAQEHIRGKQSAHRAIAQVPTLPFIAVEGCRERMSMNRCDRRGALSHAKACFPGVDFSEVASEYDSMWDERHAQAVNEGARGSRYVIGERTPALIGRASRFMEWIMKRPECSIAVVSHREFLLTCLSTLAADSPPGLAKALSRGFNNCELRSVVFNMFGVPIDLLQSTYYAGGVARLWLFPVNVAKQQVGRVWASMWGSKHRSADPADVTRDDEAKSVSTQAADVKQQR